MSNERVDVLEVIDDVLSVNTGLLPDEIEGLRKVRAAVAELIEANRKIATIYGPLSASMRIGSERREAWRDLFNALSRIGGADDRTP